MKANEKAGCLQAFITRLTATYDSLDGRKAEKLLARLLREVKREEAWARGETGLPIDALIKAIKAPVITPAPDVKREEATKPALVTNPPIPPAPEVKTAEKWVPPVVRSL